MFLSDAAIVQAVADLLSQPVANLPAKLGTLASPGNAVVEAHAAAYNEVLGRLLNRGFTLAQITAWDQGPFYERMISLYFVMIDVAGTLGYDDRWVKQYDRRADLATVLVAAAGVFSTPAAPAGAGTVGVGTMDTSSDLIVADPNALQRGRVTRW